MKTKTDLADYNTFKKKSLSRRVDIKPITADFTSGRDQRILLYLVQLYIFKDSTNISLVIPNINPPESFLLISRTGLNAEY